MKKAKIILNRILDWVEEEIEIHELSTGKYRWVSALEGRGAIKRIRIELKTRDLREKLRYLKRKKLIEESARGTAIVFSLTDSGRRRVLLNALARSGRHAGDAHTIVVFDVPESQRSARKVFRDFIRRIGFTQLQRSVWMSDLDCGGRLWKFVCDNKLQRWINVIITNKIYTSST